VCCVRACVRACATQDTVAHGGGSGEQ
jgi:hypothetical protein